MSERILSSLQLSHQASKPKLQTRSILPYTEATCRIRKLFEQGEAAMMILSSDSSSQLFVKISDFTFPRLMSDVISKQVSASRTSRLGATLISSLAPSRQRPPS